MSIEPVFLSLAILSSSFWGSWHCAAMCGPIATIVARRDSLWAYHMGRGVSYVVLGMVAGYIGTFFLKNQFYFIRLFSGYFFAALLVGMGLRVLMGKQRLDLPKLGWLHAKFNTKTPPYLLGIMTVFLPCGWLYTYIVASVATQSILTGGMVMFLFWVGGLPALSALSIFVKKSVSMAPKRKQTIAGSILLAAGLYSVISFYFFSAV